MTMRSRRSLHPKLATLCLAVTVACSPGGERGEERQGASGAPFAAESPRSILLVTLDTTRGDVVGYAGGAASTPALDRLADEGYRFDHAYATAPMTLPSHASMLTGLYPAGHGVHENGRALDRSIGVVAEELERRGYRTAAFVSGYPLSRPFGLARGFAHFDDEFALEAVERRADETTDAALEYLEAAAAGAAHFLWVHYFDAHDPFEAPEPFASRFAGEPYAAEVAWVDHQMERLVQAFRARAGKDAAILVVGDHGEGLGDQGEERHGNLLSQGVMRVPLVVAAPGRGSGVVEHPVSVRRVFHTLRDLAGREDASSLLGDLLPGGRIEREVVLAEAMKPYLQYGWQPQVMAVAEGQDGVEKTVRSGERWSVYELSRDPSGEIDLAGVRRPLPEVVDALRGYPLPRAPGGEEEESPAGPAATATPTVTLSERDAEQLAALGYLVSTTPPELRGDAPHAADQVELFPLFDRGAALFTAERWVEASAVYEELAVLDPANSVALLQLAVSRSLAGERAAAEAAFARAAKVAPESVDRKRYEALHHCRFGALERAADLLLPIERFVRRNVPALECLAEVHLARGELPRAEAALTEVVALRPGGAAVQAELALVRMALGSTRGAISSFEAAEAVDAASIEPHRLELAVLYLADGQYDRAAELLDRIEEEHPEYAMVLFKRAQVAVLRAEPDAEAWIERARAGATPETRALIERERLFAGTVQR